MEWLLIPYYAVLNRLRGWSFIDWQARRKNIDPDKYRENHIQTWEKAVEFIRGKYLCAVYCALPFLAVSPSVSLYVALSIAILFSVGVNPIFSCIHRNKPELGAGEHKHVFFFSDVVDKFIDWKERPVEYGIAWGALRFSVLSLPLAAVLTLYVSHIGVILPILLSTAGLCYYVGGLINIKYAIPIAEVIVGGLLIGSVVSWTDLLTMRGL